MLNINLKKPLIFQLNQKLIAKKSKTKTKIPSNQSLSNKAPNITSQRTKTQYKIDR